MTKLPADAWRSAALDSRSAAGELMRSGRHRSSISRSYYSLYWELAGRLTDRDASGDDTRANPTHAGLPKRVMSMSNLGPDARRQLKSTAARLYQLRVFADYHPGQTIDQMTAREVLGKLHRAVEILEDADANG